MMNEITDVREMRKAITEMSYTGNKIGDSGDRMEYSATAALARHCLRSAEARGFSGEDAMTLLAYHAILQLEKAYGMLLENAALASPSPIFRTASPLAHE
jgi:hypothetical protein